MATQSSSNTNSGALRGISSQFSGLDRRDPSTWPALPRYVLLVVIAAVVVGVAWFLVISSANDQLETARAQETKLKDEYKTKVQRAVNLDALKRQREQVGQYVAVLEKQLPSKSEMAALLSDINQAGLGRSLQFDLFKPEPPIMREYYAEQPISLKISGRYNDMGAFAQDVAQLPRIVTLNNISIAPANDKAAAAGSLTMDATAKTFRYLDPEEIAIQRAAAKKSGNKGGQP